MAYNDKSTKNTTNHFVEATVQRALFWHWESWALNPSCWRAVCPARYDHKFWHFANALDCSDYSGVTPLPLAAREFSRNAHVAVKMAATCCHNMVSEFRLEFVFSMSCSPALFSACAVLNAYYIVFPCVPYLRWGMLACRRCDSGRECTIAMDWHTALRGR